jgi:Flp pilus assembly protein TadB
MTNELASDKVVLSAPLSFIGSAARIWKITKTDNMAVKWLVLTPLALALICAAWTFVACWYFVMYVLFGIFFIPYRLLRRSSRKQKRDRLRHHELLSAIREPKEHA